MPVEFETMTTKSTSTQSLSVPYPFFSPRCKQNSVNTALSQEIPVYTINHWNNSKRCSVHARPVCGAIILLQRYSKNWEKDLEHVHKPCVLCTNLTQQQEDEDSGCNKIKSKSGVIRKDRQQSRTSPQSYTRSQVDKIFWYNGSVSGAVSKGSNWEGFPSRC